MPTSPALKVTDAYRSRLQALVTSASRDARSAWTDLEWADIDASYQPIQRRVARSVERAQTEAVRLTAGYLGAFLTMELGEPVGAPTILVRDYVGKSFGGLPLFDSLDKPRIALLSANVEGADPMGVGLRVMLANVDLDVKGAARSALQDQIEADERIEGWQRAVKGTCAACMGAAGNEHGVAMPVHPHCQCVSEPLVESKAPESLPSITGTAEGQIVEQFLGVGPSQLPYSRQVNAMLRGLDSEGTHSTAQLKQMVRKMDLALSQRRVDAPVSAWRQVKGLEFEVGQTFTDLGYGSTSANNLYKVLGEVPGGANLHLTISPEVRAAWGANPSEAELLLERGCRYAIRSKVKNAGGGWDIEATVFPPAK